MHNAPTKTAEKPRPAGNIPGVPRCRDAARHNMRWAMGDLRHATGSCRKSQIAGRRSQEKTAGRQT
ncbi:MAG: hypothetical protein LBI89_03365, partial [Prevotellaceae bacterium]|nr:hypothetical protein [Prevotellaceae bacterium]